MRLHAEARSLDQPLPGGVENASVVVEPMVAGEIRWSKPAVERDPGRLWRLRMLGIGVPEDDRWWLPVPAYLVRHPGAGAILIDTGLHPSIATDPRQNFGRLAARAAPTRLEQGADAPSQLRGKGIGPEDVGVVIMTHLHMDHASAISEFPQSTFVFSAAEWEDAITGSRPLLRSYRPAHYDHLFDYRTVDFDSEAVSSYGPFGRSFDLLGDGSIRLAYTPGHSAGHISVILRLPRRDFVVVGDAAYTWRQLIEGTEQPRPRDLHNWRRSLGELQHYHRDYPYAVMAPGHDREFHLKLEERYAE